MSNKPRFFALFFYLVVLSASFSPLCFSTEATTPPTEEENTQGEQADENKKPPNPERTLPDTQKHTFELLKKQYPKSDLRTLDANGQAFSGLWRKDQSGQAYGAVLLLPADGQTANWPHTIEVLRKDLPKNGWSTLSIDIKPLPHIKTPSKLDSDLPTVEEASVRDEENNARIQAAINFLHNEGQYNIVLAAYGNSANRVLNYAIEKVTPPKKAKPTGKQHTIRALVLMNPTSYDGGALSDLYSSFNLKDLPMLDLVLGSHQLDTQDAEARKTQARAQRMQTYIQLKLIEPSTTVFTQENRVSRRVRGFLNKHAKGVEVDRR